VHLDTSELGFDACVDAVAKLIAERTGR